MNKRSEKKITGIAGLLILLLLFLTCIKKYDHDFPDNTSEQRKAAMTSDLIQSLNSDSIKSTVLWLQNMGTRFALANNRRVVATRLRDRFIRMGYANARLDSFLAVGIWRYQNYSTWQYNVVAELSGSEHPDSLMIMGAHYDNVLSAGDPLTEAPGANDNASGVAAMIEIARVMKLKQYSPSVSLQFTAFAAEEIGLLGSFDYASKIALSGRPVRFMINNDMIAYEPAQNSTSWSVKLNYYKNSLDLLSFAKKLCGKYIGLTTIPDTMDIKRSDSYSFYRKNFKSIFFASKASDTNYHTLNDVVVNCNFEYCRDVTGISVALIVNSD